MLIRLSIGTRAANCEMKASLVEIGVQSEVETSIQLIIQAEPLSETWLCLGLHGCNFL